MNGPTNEQHASGISAAVQLGDIVSGTITELDRTHSAVVRLDDPLSRISASIGLLDVSWRHRPEDIIRIGRRITAEVIAVEEQPPRIRLSLAATENPELWAFLKALRPGEVIGGEIADVQRFGVFVALDDGPPHPIYPGVGFITIPELSWRHFADASEIVETGQRVTGSVLCFDTTQGEARLSLRALQPDPFQEFADVTREGQEFLGTVTKVVPFGVFVRVADGIEGLLPSDELAPTPVEAVQVGDHVHVRLIDLDRTRRRLLLSR
ncbi:S1 RNA-binding domain-containing protein [Nonomuraea sp. NN258]|nr:S1 RNA-binding domain-containing protein [Nonomuraea antri]